MSFEETVRKIAGPLSPERIEVADWRDIDVASIEAGIVFVLAVWSGPAHVSMKALVQALTVADVPKPRLIVVDTDGIDFDDYVALFGQPPGGWGESCWIRDGRVVHRAFNGKSAAENEEKLRELFGASPPTP